MHRTFASSAFALLGLQSVPDGRVAEIERDVAALLPQPFEERWLRIPWHSNLVRARREALRSDRPLFLWVMDGNTLGCT